MILMRPREAEEKLTRAIELDPCISLFHVIYAIFLNNSRHYGEALARIRTALRIDAGMGYARDPLGGGNPPGHCPLPIRQRNWRGDIDAPKTQAGHRTLALGSLVDEYRARRGVAPPDARVFPQPDCPRRPMWDSTVRYAIHTAAQAAGCDFVGLGPHSFRRINVNWRQEAGASAIEAAQIAGHSTVRQTYDYTRTQLKRQEETTRAIQERLVGGGIDTPNAAGDHLLRLAPVREAPSTY